MNRIADPCPETKSPTIAPIHARLREETEALRRAATDLERRVRRYPHVRPDSAEAIYLRFVANVLEDAEAFYARATDGAGRLALDFERDEEGYHHARLRLRPPPAKVISLAEERERRQRAGG